MQDTAGVEAMMPVDADWIADQARALLEDMPVAAFKIGFVGNLHNIGAIASIVADYPDIPLVLDPVMVATSGDRLIAEETVEVLVKQLFPRALLVTPNLDEAALLLGRPLQNTESLQPAAQALIDLGAQAVLLKGGHLPGETVVDVLQQGGQHALTHAAARIHSRNVHGTGCSLSSAIAANLALGASLDQAVAKARSFIHQAILQGAHVKTGQGHGPLNHGHAPQVMRQLPSGLLGE